MTNIYDQHRAAFANVSAFVVLDDAGERVATVAIKFPRDGAGRLWAYVHLIGVPVVRAYASGYGYDKRSAAVAAAIAKIPAYDLKGEPITSEYGERINATREAFKAAAPAMDSDDWTRALERQGFRVIQAV